MAARSRLIWPGYLNVPKQDNEEAIGITFLVISALESLHINYLLGGSLASAIYGEPRATRDADIVADIGPEHVAPICKLLRPEFNVEEEAILNAIQFRSSFNAIHLLSLFKVDLFIPKDRTFEQEEFKRRVLRKISSEPERHAFVATAEDIILAKLEWYRLGNEVSEQQWRDITGVFKVNEGTLDLNYLVQMAEQLDVSNLLEKLLP